VIHDHQDDQRADTMPYILSKEPCVASKEPCIQKIDKMICIAILNIRLQRRELYV